MSNKRYMFFDGNMGSGGAERVITLLANRMIENGESIEVLTYRRARLFFPLDKRVKVHSVCEECSSSSLPARVKWMRRHIKENADCFISFLAPYNMLALVATRGLKVEVIVADRNDPRFVPEKKPVRFMRDFLYRFADKVVCQTDSNKAYFEKSIGQKCSVISNPVNLPEQWRGAALKAETKKVVVSVGRLKPQKNQRMLLEAFALFHKQFPDYSLVVYGEGDMRDELVRLAANLGVKDSVSFPGNETDIFSKLSEAAMFVLSSNYEGMPNALLEAMCVSLPVVSTKVSGAVDLIIDGENGLLVDCGNSNQLADAMIKMMSDETLRKRCAEKAGELNEKLSIESVSSEWESLLNIEKG